MKLPNGYGSVFKISGNRRNPWAVRLTESWSIDGDKLKRNYRYLGYYPTRTAALQALAEYHKNPYDVPPDITFAEIYEKWSERKYQTVSSATVASYKAAYKVCEPIYNAKLNELKLLHFQKLLDESQKNYSMKYNVKCLLNQIYDFAVQNEVIGKDKHIIEYIDIGKKPKSTKHYRFSQNELKILWENSDDEYVQLILMLIYSGVRPGEMFNLKKTDINLKEKSFVIRAGKTENAMRKVPIHKKTLPFFKNWMKKDGDYLITTRTGKRIDFKNAHTTFTNQYWQPLLSGMGIYYYTNEWNEKQEHSPHDTRHTFTTLWHEQRLDEAIRRKIQGHSPKGIGEEVYSHLDFQVLKMELDKLK